MGRFGSLLLAAAVPAVVLAQTCPGQDLNRCTCGWAQNGANCGTDNGSECYCRCCCEVAGGCRWNGWGGNNGGGGTCALPDGMTAGAAVAEPQTGAVGCHGKLRLGGPGGLQLVGERGEAVQLRGMSSHGIHWFGGCYTFESVEHLAVSWGANMFRVAMYVGEGGYASDPSLADKVYEMVDWCEALGIYVLIDWHILNPGNPNDATYSGAEAFWRRTARMLKGKKHVLYEIANEPNGVSWGEVKRYHDRIIAVIRAEDPETVIVAGTPTWSQDIHLAAADPVAQPHNVMYAFHFYAGTHMQLVERVERVASQIPLFVTEWGTSEASGDGGPFLGAAKRFLDVFNAAGAYRLKLSWAQWSYADKAEKSAALAPGACGRRAWDDVSCSGSFIREYLRLGARSRPCQQQTTPPATPPPATPTPTPAPTPGPTPGRTPTPTRATPPPPASTAVPPATTTTPGACGAFADCTSDAGCCDAGLECVAVCDTYSQCRPRSQLPPAPAGCAAAVAEYGACKGAPACCVDWTVCVQVNPHYSQCLRPEKP